MQNAVAAPVHDRAAAASTARLGHRMAHAETAVRGPRTTTHAEGMRCFAASAVACAAALADPIAAAAAADAMEAPPAAAPAALCTAPATPLAAAVAAERTAAGLTAEAETTAAHRLLDACRLLLAAVLQRMSLAAARKPAWGRMYRGTACTDDAFRFVQIADAATFTDPSARQQQCASACCGQTVRSSRG